MRIARELTIAFAAYSAASFVHYAHNAAMLPAYPNMPDWLTRSLVVLAGCALALVGATGYWLSTTRFRGAGLVVLACYAAFGFDGLAHYSVAPISAHTVVMNATILVECIAAAILLASITRSAAQRQPRPG